MKNPTAVQTNKLVRSKLSPKTPSQAQVDAMAESILSYGIMEPLLVTRLGDRYEITPGGGQVRWLAAKKLAMDIVPIRVVELDDHSKAAVALICNTVRENIAPEEVINSLERLVSEFGVNAADIVTERLPELQEISAEHPEFQDRIKSLLDSCEIEN
ncbi:ParB N-terminal domain-containing protein (plasmid) [Pseudomonas veronii]|uniref:ParB N-terminal domain-containing protein n=3 Tax=Pseudomonas TaxID=286 RepID=A0A9Q5FNV5_PSEFR|nr:MULTISPECIES: ParB N-terminal domain-containing protein [Pseudomonas]AZP73799.1 chromosome partitioning protein ParB [Pseudomonas poae]MBT9570533.1 ParB N-terminal domain-containing protein [Pseudomonas umsongensis]MBH8612312.1 ParB N-terminal domain-containing protein [Pseudomonas mohnii]NMZ20375.1 ParB N-terminal domain-containing protein [Pseudomonas rhodesiae]NNB49790.1 ParB N-terminal domain-containing protein [Pseudomonas fragi]